MAGHNERPEKWVCCSNGACEGWLHGTDSVCVNGEWFVFQWVQWHWPPGRERERRAAGIAGHQSITHAVSGTSVICLIKKALLFHTNNSSNGNLLTDKPTVNVAHQHQKGDLNTRWEMAPVLSLHTLLPSYQSYHLHDCCI